MKHIRLTMTVLACAAGFAARANPLTVEELGAVPGEVVTINCNNSGNILVDAGVLQLNVDGVLMNGFCIDPFHFSSGSMAGYQQVELTSAPKDNVMSAGTALLVDRLWGSYYSPSMSAQDAAGLQIAIWELTGGSCFKLSSSNDYGAAGFLSSVESSNYEGPVADLVALTGPGQDYAVERTSVTQFVQTVPDNASTLGLMLLGVIGLFCLPRKELRLAPVRI